MTDREIVCTFTGIALGIALLGASMLFDTPGVTVEWANGTIHDRQIGLRSDGVVVWRKWAAKP